MKPILLILSTVIALSIMVGCIEDKNDQKGHKPSSHSEKKQESSVSDKPHPMADTIGLSRSKYQVIVENNLFRPLGWQKEVVKKTTPTTETIVEIHRERPAPTYNLTLTGIAQDGSQWIAILEDRIRKEGYFLYRGEKLKDSLVSEIFPEHIVLVQRDAKAQLSLGESIQYDANGQILLNTIANQSTLPSHRNSELKDQEALKKSLIERMKARRKKELGQE